MRSLEECKKEVYLRSEKRIKRRRQICGHVLTLCISLCLVPLCLVLLSLPFFSGDKEKSASPENAGTAYGNANILYTSAEIHRAEHGDPVKVITQPNELDMLYSAIQAVFTGQESSPESGEGIETAKDPSDTASFSYHITFKAPNQEQLRYLLTETMLTNETTGEYMHLTPSQLLKLQALLAVLEE